MSFFNFCKFHGNPIKNESDKPRTSISISVTDTTHTVMDTTIPYLMPLKSCYRDTNMYITLEPLDMAYWFTYMTLNSKAIKKKYYRDGHYIILVLIKSLIFASVLQMLSCGSTTFAIFS